ncbi:hypothetical protein, partial [Klebsiella pneumoniae]|uniref:hypothetical protein n=1 Tax=Klebsiella pneumoniae TaxID=573 RepID=UPI003012B7B3
RLSIKDVGGLFNWVWEGQNALIHVEGKDIPAIFEPRNNYLQATKRLNNGAPILVNAGFSSKQDAIAMGIKSGLSTVTMPKRMI